MKKFAAGFTLTEVLAVVIIIGVLTAVSLPWFERAVEKARAVEARQIIDTAYKAEQMFFMTHSVYAINFSDLDVDIPWEDVDADDWGNWFSAAKSDGRWVINLERGTNTNVSIVVGRPSGKYEGAGFLYQMICTNYPAIPLHRALCIEKKDAPHKFKGTPGTYCAGIMGGRLVEGNTGSYRVYRI